ncbi:MAG: hypothetical protein ACP5QY_00005 [Candidatus Hydrogenedens sp.]
MKVRIKYGIFLAEKGGFVVTFSLTTYVSIFYRDCFKILAPSDGGEII